MSIGDVKTIQLKQMKKFTKWMQWMCEQQRHYSLNLIANERQ